MYLKAVGALFILLAAGVADAQVGLNVDVESAVREKFVDAPVMISVARCESKFRQYTDAGNPLYGGYGGKMVGVYQIYSDVHLNYASTLGMDIETLEGNLAYAKRLYEREGTTPWLSSFPCWGKEANETAPSDSVSAPDSITVNLSLGMEHPQVLVLQKTLNTKGYVIATDGPGSPGNETQKFGSLTRAAVKKFQCAQMQICDGDEYSNGYGFVGAKTRAALAGASAVATQPSVQTPTRETSTQSPPTNVSSDEEKQIAELKQQIAALQKQLEELLAKSQ